MRSKKFGKEASAAKKEKKIVNKKNNKDGADGEGKRSKGKKVPGNGDRDSKGEEFWEVSVLLFIYLRFCFCVFCGKLCGDKMGVGGDPVELVCGREWGRRNEIFCFGLTWISYSCRINAA